MEGEIIHFNYNSKHYDKYKFVLKLIGRLTVSNLFPLDNIANFVYYMKTRMEFSLNRKRNSVNSVNSVNSGNLINH